MALSQQDYDALLGLVQSGDYGTIAQVAPSKLSPQDYQRLVNVYTYNGALSPEDISFLAPQTPTTNMEQLTQLQQNVDPSLVQALQQVIDAGVSPPTDPDPYSATGIVQPVAAPDPATLWNPGPNVYGWPNVAPGGLPQPVIPELTRDTQYDFDPHGSGSGYGLGVTYGDITAGNFPAPSGFGIGATPAQIAAGVFPSTPTPVNTNLYNGLQPGGQPGEPTPSAPTGGGGGGAGGGVAGIGGSTGGGFGQFGARYPSGQGFPSGGGSGGAGGRIPKARLAFYG